MIRNRKVSENNNRRPPRVALSKEFKRRMRRVEPLRDDLRPYLEETNLGLFIRHPFCNSPVLDLDRCFVIHDQIDRRAAKADACFEAHDYEGYLDCVERSMQPEWFAKDAEQYTDPQYWRLLRGTYMGQRFTHHNRDLFDELFRAERPGKEHLMTGEERGVLAELPDVLTVYRGFGDDDYTDGFAWTLHRPAAIWYAHWDRQADWPRVLVGKVRKQDVWAYLSGGDVLLPPEAVRRPKVKDVSGITQARVAWDEYVPEFNVNRYIRND